MITKDIFNQDIILENERVLLRPLLESDFGNLLLSRPEIGLHKKVNLLTITLIL